MGAGWTTNGIRRRKLADRDPLPTTNDHGKHRLRLPRRADDRRGHRPVAPDALGCCSAAARAEDLRRGRLARRWRARVGDDHALRAPGPRYAYALGSARAVRGTRLVPVRA